MTAVGSRRVSPGTSSSLTTAFWTWGLGSRRRTGHPAPRPAARRRRGPSSRRRRTGRDAASWSARFCRALARSGFASRISDHWGGWWLACAPRHGADGRPSSGRVPSRQPGRTAMTREPRGHHRCTTPSVVPSTHVSPSRGIPCSQRARRIPQTGGGTPHPGVRREMHRRTLLELAGATALLRSLPASAATAPAPGLRVTRLTWAGIRLVAGETTLFVDATVDPSEPGSTPLQASTPERHALVTHYHGDHCQPEALKPVFNARSRARVRSRHRAPRGRPRGPAASGGALPARVPVPPHRRFRRLRGAGLRRSRQPAGLLGHRWGRTQGVPRRRHPGPRPVLEHRPGLRPVRPRLPPHQRLPPDARAHHPRAGAHVAHPGAGGRGRADPRRPPGGSHPLRERGTGVCRGARMRSAPS